MARDQRRLAAVVSVDVARHRRVMGQHEGGNMLALQASAARSAVTLPTPVSRTAMESP
jgi:hypothetical protein